MTVLASPERVASILDILRDFLSRKSVPFSKFKRLVGKLSFVAQIISGGRTFLRHLFDAYPSSRHGCVKISPFVLADLSWWFRFLPAWNGSLKIQLDSDRCRFAFTSDASDTAGYPRTELWSTYGPPNSVHGILTLRSSGLCTGASVLGPLNLGGPPS
jgi:hypothetical protein